MILWGFGPLMLIFIYEKKVKKTLVLLSLLGVTIFGMSSIQIGGDNIFSLNSSFSKSVPVPPIMAAFRPPLRLRIKLVF
jgi:hypothetical protein